MADAAVLDPLPFLLGDPLPDFDDLDDLNFDLDDLLVLPDGQDLLSLADPEALTSSSNHSSNSCSPESPHSSSSGVTRKLEEDSYEAEPGSKRKRKSGEDSPPPQELQQMTSEEEEKRRARLMRNRESAQLSRQRKKHYVEELEEKLRAMHSTINELNSRISFVMAENAALRQHLGSGNAAVPSPSPLPAGAVYPPPPPLMQFPWIPCAGYTLRPNGAAVPLVPIPRLKPQHPTSSSQKSSRKSENKKKESKIKKAASISLLGLLFFMLIFGVTPRFGGNSVDRNYRGRVLSVTGKNSGVNGTDEIGLCRNGGRSGLDIGWFDPVTGKRCNSGFDGSTNSSEQLPALLYVPRNGKHVKINGNLIIHSILASEKAVAHATSREQGSKVSSVKDSKETGLAIHRNLGSGLAVPGVGRNVERLAKLKESSNDNSYGESLKSATDGPLHQWFREGLAGPILSSGMCTEVFQFEASGSSQNPSGIIPAHSIINSTTVNTNNSKLPHPPKTKNRRILYSQPIPLPGSTLNKTSHFSNSSSENSNENKPVSSMVVSVLADPREAGDGEGMMSSPRSLSRIFVVVLIDGVKYVTYSCGLPMKSQSPHLVN